MNKFGPFSMILLGINGIIGSGLFLLPAKIASLVGNWSLLLYAVIALLAMAIGWSFTQCSLLFSRNGGAYLYAKEAFGPFVGFEIGLIRWAVAILSWASLAVGCATVVASIYPPAAPWTRLSAALLILLFGGLNCFGVRPLRALNNIITFAKLLPLFAFIVIGIVFFSPSFSSFPPIQPGSIGQAALLVFYSFSGFEILPTTAAEMEDPKKNIPRAVPITIASTALVYLLIQTICLTTLGAAYSATPVSDAMQRLLGPIGGGFVALATLISVAGGLLAISFVAPRSCVAMAEDGFIFSSLVRKNRFQAPYFAIAISALLASIMAFTGDFVQLAAISVLSRFAQHISTTLALFVFHRKKLLTPFGKLWKIAIPVIALGGIGYLLVQAEWHQLLFGFGAFLVGVPLYVLQRFIQRRKKNLMAEKLSIAISWYPSSDSEKEV